MPIYEYACPGCHLQIEVLRAHNATHHELCRCGTLMKRLISMPATTMAELTPYYDDGLGVRVESRQFRRRYAKDRGLEPVG